MSAWIQAHVKPGMTAVDVGANVGSVVRQLLQAVGSEGAVYAIEPDPRCGAALRELLPPDRMLAVALGEGPGQIPFFRSIRAEHNSRYVENVVDPGVVEAIEVELASLDSLQAEKRLPARIDAIKVDAQGSELEILRGARRLNATQKPVWYVEIWPAGLAQSGASVEALCAEFEAQGYRPETGTWSEARASVAHLMGHSSHDWVLKAA